MHSEQEAVVAAIESASLPFVGRWNRLVSTTNWEKGRIICDWRSSLVAENSAASEYADETWARIVGGVTGQHVGRLRRVYERFGDVHGSYDGLFWSHFQAALDWNDAEMWLEGALQNDWSVSQMRARRAQTLGQVAGDESLVESEAAELDEDYQSPADSGAPGLRLDGVPMAVTAVSDVDRAEDADEDGEASWADDELADEPEERDISAPPAPFANLPQLPADLAEAVECFKLAIIRHRAGGWREVTQRDIVITLDALKSLTLAAAE
jgi:hypothetical protein